MEAYSTQLIAVPQVEIRFQNTSYGVRFCFRFFSVKRRKVVSDHTGAPSFYLGLFSSYIFVASSSCCVLVSYIVTQNAFVAKPDAKIINEYDM
jgi:hypothetical protein